VRFLSLSPIVAYALLAGVALIITLLHLLRPPPRRVVVPSLLLWVRVSRNRKHPDARQLVLLLLALGAGLSLALALTRPEIPAIGASAQRLALILDNSPSMAARTHDGRTRWQHAVERARALLEESGAASEVMLVDTIGRLRWSGYVDRDAALAALAQVPLPAWGNARMPPAALLAGAQVHLFTDGVAQVDAQERAIVHSVFEPADNVAVTAFEARPLAQNPTRYEALVQVLNASPGDLRARLLITGDDRFSITQDLDLHAGETVNATFDVSDFEGGVLGAAVVFKEDAYASDDLAYAAVPPHRPKRVLLVTPGNPPLEDALRSLPGVRLAVVTPDSYPRAGEHDAAVFDRFAPAEPPAAGALLLRPPARKWLAGQSPVLTHPRITTWNGGHAVTGGIAWRNLRLARAALSSTPDIASDALVLASGSASGAVVTAGNSQARWIQVGFALQDSNFSLQPDFPVFLGNALSWVNAPIPVLARGLGSVEVALPGAQVHDGSGNSVAASVTPQGIVFEASRADVYTVSAPSGEIVVVANLADPRYSQINRTRLSGGEATAVQRDASAQAWNAELWVLLLLLAGAFLLFEWAVFTRPRTVY
jgi:hypothetical protein